MIQCETELAEVTATYALTSKHINYLTIVDESGNEQVIETTNSHPFWVVTDEPDLSRAARDVVDENDVTFYHENLDVTENGYWVEAKDLQVGDVFLDANGELVTLVQTCREEYSDGITVYNFEVADNHNYFIIARDDEYGQTCILVHNAGYSIRDTLKRIDEGKFHPHRNDGSIFKNREGKLPDRPLGFYREYVNEDINIPNPGAERIITGLNGDVWYSPDHYVTFIKIRGN